MQQIAVIQSVQVSGAERKRPSLRSTGHDVRMHRIHPGRKGVILPGAYRQNDGIAARGLRQQPEGMLPGRGFPGKSLFLAETEGIRVDEFHVLPPFLPAFHAHYIRFFSAQQLWYTGAIPELMALLG